MDNLRVALKSLSRRVGRLKRDTRLLRFLDQLQRYAFELNTERNALQAHLAQLNSLIETSALITSSLEISEVLAGVLDAVASLTGAEYCLILLRHPESGDLELKAAWDSHGYTPERPTYSSSMVWQAINTRQPVLTRNAIIDERFQDKSSVQVNVLRSVIVMPLVINDRVIGALYADNREKEAIFSEESFRIFKAFANQAAIAISNARDYE